MSRFIPKIFAENATDNVVFGSWWEQGGQIGDGTVSNDPATLQGNAAWPLGLGAATNNFFKLMRSEELNGVLRVITTSILQQMEDGLTFWQPEMPVTQYQTIVQYQTGSDLPKLYVNITGTSTSTPPDSDTTNWYMFFDTAQVSANISLTNSPYTTNRILEIPQNIKLELNNGTLTLKAGSKVYVPNGAGVFDEIAIQSDASTNLVWAPNSTNAIFVRENGTIASIGIGSSNSDWWSGSNPTITKQYGYRYDTANNIIQNTNDTGSTWSGKYSFPICLVTSDANQKISSIDQIFNGFGYIGSTVFALPMKGQATTAINNDGTVTSTTWETTTVQTLTVLASGSVSMSSAGVLTFGFNEVGYTKLADVTYYSSRIQDVNFYGVAFVANSNLSNLTNGLANTICTTPATTTSTATNQIPAVVVKNYRNGKSWYRIWSDGWIEQGGEVDCTNGNATVNLLVAHNNSNYSSSLTLVCESPSTFYSGVIYGKNTTGFTVYQNVGYSFSIKGQWRTEGY